MRRTAVLVSLAVVAAGFTTLGLSSPASAAVTTTHITSPANGTHYLVTNSQPATTVSVTGTSNGVNGVDQVDIRCYYNLYEWRNINTVTVGVGGSFTSSMSTGDPYGTCTLRAVPHTYPAGSSLSAFSGPRITGEWITTDKITSGPNTGKTYDYYVQYQSAKALNDYVSVSSGGLYDSRLQYADGTSSYRLWYDNASLERSEGGTRSFLKIDGKNAFGPNAASGLFTGSQDVTGFPTLSFSTSRNATTGVTTIHETDAFVRCNTETFPPTSVSCTSYLNTGVRLERTIITDDGGRQVHITDTWRSTDGHAHTLSAHYDQWIQARDFATATNTVIGLLFPWISSAYQPFTAEALLAGTTTVPRSIFVRDNNSAPNGNLLFPRGAITIDTPVNQVHWDQYDNFTLRDENITVPAGGTRRVRHDYVIGNTEAEIAAKAAAARVRINPRRPDGLIRKGSNAYVGNNIYNSTGAGQTATAKKKRGTKATFYALIQNDGTFTDTFKLKGTGNKKGFTVSYFAGTKDITSQVEHGTYGLSNLASGQQRVIKVVIKVKATAKKGALRSWLITSTSTHDTTSKDTVRANVRVKK